MVKRIAIIAGLVAALLAATVITAAAQSEGQIGGIVYEDANGNGIREEGEPGIQDIEVEFSNEGFSTVINTTSTGAFSLAVNPATWDVAVINLPDGYAIDDDTREVVIENPGDAVTNLEFALVPVDEDSEDSDTLPESGGPISEGTLIAILIGIVVIGAAAVVTGQMRSRSNQA